MFFFSLNTYGNIEPHKQHHYVCVTKQGGGILQGNNMQITSIYNKSML